MCVIRYKHPEEWIWEVVKTTPLGRAGLGLKRHSNNSHKVGHMCQGVYVQCSCGHDRFLKIYSNVYVYQC